jgi:AcrR family transcriptional regulator
MAPDRLSPTARAAQIVKTSMALFARKGFSGTTSRELARVAGVSETLIYRLFPTKRALYSAIIQHIIAGTPPFTEHAALREESDRDYFRRLAGQVLERIRSDNTVLRLMVYSALEGHALSSMFYDTHVSHVLDHLRRRIRAGIRAGRYRAVDPYLAARAFHGMLMHYALSQELFLRKRRRAAPVRIVAQAFIDLFFSGLGKRRD